jgi:hypothetical protein
MESTVHVERFFVLHDTRKTMGLGKPNIYEIFIRIPVYRHLSIRGFCQKSILSKYLGLLSQ